MRLNNIFDAIPANLNEELFDSIIEQDNIKIERIISKGHVSPKQGWHQQDKNEWVIVLKGNATIVFDNAEELNLKAGSYVNIPANRKHKVTWTNPDIETVWIAVHY